jgi:hypothetical protein
MAGAVKLTEEGFWVVSILVEVLLIGVRFVELLHHQLLSCCKPLLLGELPWT